MPKSTPQASFPFLGNRDVVVTFDGEVLTSDAGLPLLRQIDDRFGLTRRLGDALVEWRAPGFIRHSMHELVRMRVFGIIQGYEDCNDFTQLRYDPLFEATCGDKVGKVLASQPTLSRFEHEASRGGLHAAHRVLLESYVRRWKVRFRRPAAITLDVDATDDPTHGQQPLAFFNGFYGGYCYRHLLVHTDEGDLLAARLLPGTGNLRPVTLEVLREVVATLRAAFPAVTLRLRADSGFSGPELYDFCEDECIEYFVNPGTHASMVEKCGAYEREARRLYNAGGEQGSVQVFREFTHQATTWRQPRRIVVKAQRTPVDSDVRLLVTTHAGPQWRRTTITSTAVPPRTGSRT